MRRVRRLLAARCYRCKAWVFFKPVPVCATCDATLYLQAAAIKITVDKRLKEKDN
jgi:hypothetical protein